MAENALYVVATPIGNLADMSARAIEVLQQADLIAAEDTRHSARLMSHFDIGTNMVALHDHNERQRSEMMVEKLQAGQSIALVSDAGTPLISDPGYHLVKAVREAGFRVIPVPGACAMVAALSVGGLPTDRFIFEGFLPAKSGGRQQRLQALSEDSRTQVFYESPHRIQASLQDMLDVLGDRQAVIARELTKTFETIKDGSLSELIEFVGGDSNQQKGEFVVLVAGAPEQEKGEIDGEVARILGVLLKDLPKKQAAALASEITGIKKNALYKYALTLDE